MKEMIETEVLKQTAAQLMELKGKLDAEIARMYAEIQDLSVSYQGQASNAFNAKLEEQRPAFEQISKAVSGYSEYLLRVAEDKEMTETAIVDGANKL